MPAVSGDRFTSYNLIDCAFCPEDGRRFRTQRQCAGCGKALCLACRVEIPGHPFQCPECGGGPEENALLDPGAALDRLAAAGLPAPFWLKLAHARQTLAGTLEAEIVPE